MRGGMGNKENGAQNSRLYDSMKFCPNHYYCPYATVQIISLCVSACVCIEVIHVWTIRMYLMIRRGTGKEASLERQKYAFVRK